jgi:glycerol-3-phosphate dehydrogenase
VDAAWTGIRPLARDFSAAGASSGNGSTASISRDHVVELTAPRVVSIAGGKWTTYRKMAVWIMSWPFSVIVSFFFRICGADGRWW